MDFDVLKPLFECDFIGVSSQDNFVRKELLVTNDLQAQFKFLHGELAIQIRHNPMLTKSARFVSPLVFHAISYELINASQELFQRNAYVTRTYIKAFLKSVNKIEHQVFTIFRFVLDFIKSYVNHCNFRGVHDNAFRGIRFQTNDNSAESICVK
ncbi:MAG: hypothetical protein DWH99_05495 [Planctomycetota bacterium]|nr:MAG: hypothetical protein DWH99_05495 [Planctomycetota bacterium]